MSEGSTSDKLGREEHVLPTANLTAVELAEAHRRLDALPDDCFDHLKDGPDWPSDRPELLGPREDERGCPSAQVASSR